MKSFSQFLQESYLSEEEARQGSLMTRSGKPQDFRNPKKVPFTATDPTPTPASRRLPAAAPDAPKTPSGQLEIPEPKTTKVSGTSVRSAGEVRQPSLLTKSGGAQDFTKAGKGRVPFTSSEPVKATKRLPETPTTAPKTSPGQMEIDFNARPNKGEALVKRTSTGMSTKPIQQIKTDLNVPTPKGLGGSKRQLALPAAGQTSGSKSPALSGSGKPPSGTPGEIKPTTTKGKFPSGLGRNLGRAAYGLEAGLEAMDQKSKGRKTGSAITMGATKAAGGWAGMKAGVAAGGKLGSVLGPKGAAVGALVGGGAGYLAGSGIAKKASETVAGATGKEKTAMATANRQRQAGTSVKGIGGSTTFDTKKNTMTTGVGSQRKTVGLAKTGVVQRGGQSVAGNLAYKGGQAVYKAGPSAQSLAKTSSNPLERIGRSLFAGAYKKSDAANAAKKLATARQSDAARNKALGVKAKPAG
jgi:hypothetical protein